MPPMYYTFECACCLDQYESALRKRNPPTPLRRRCDECIRICGHHGGSEPECRRRAAARIEVAHYLARAWQAVGDDPALRQALTEGLQDVSERLAVRELHANPPGPGDGCSNIPDQPTKGQRR